jgi:hypothetical protein
MKNDLVKGIRRLIVKVNIDVSERNLWVTIAFLVVDDGKSGLMVWFEVMPLGGQTSINKLLPHYIHSESSIFQRRPHFDANIGIICLRWLGWTGWQNGGWLENCWVVFTFESFSRRSYPERHTVVRASMFIRFPTEIENIVDQLILLSII